MSLWILGSGAHARDVVETAQKAGGHDILGILDGHQSGGNQSLYGVRILGEVTRKEVGRLRVQQALIAIADNRTREHIALELADLVSWPVIIQPQAVCEAELEPGEGTVIFSGVVVQPDSKVGRHVILNTACEVGRDCVIGDFAHIGPCCQIGDGVEIGEGTLLGFGSNVNPGCRIGKWSIVGAGAEVVGDIPDNSVAVGVPAVVVGPVVPVVKKGKSQAQTMPLPALSRRS